MHAEPDFYLIAKQYPLENSADVLKKENEKVLKRIQAHLSKRQEATSGCEDNYNPLLTRNAPAPNRRAYHNNISGIHLHLIKRLILLTQLTARLLLKLL